MKRAYINGILLDGTQQMEPQAHKVLLCEDGADLDRLNGMNEAQAESMSMAIHEIVESF